MKKKLYSPTFECQWFLDFVMLNLCLFCISLLKMSCQDVVCLLFYTKLNRSGIVQWKFPFYNILSFYQFLWMFELVTLEVFVNLFCDRWWHLKSGMGVFMSTSTFFFFPFKPVIFVISIIMIKVALISSWITDCSQVSNEVLIVLYKLLFGIGLKPGQSFYKLCRFFFLGFKLGFLLMVLRK